MRRITHYELIQQIMNISRALDRGEFDHLFESVPECKQSLSAALNAAGLAVVDAELPGLPTHLVPKASEPKVVSLPARVMGVEKARHERCQPSALRGVW
jgi:hypothetical protein